MSLNNLISTFSTKSCKNENKAIIQTTQTSSGEIYKSVPLEMGVISQNKLMILINQEFNNSTIKKLMNNLKFNKRTFWVIVGNLQLNQDIPLDKSIPAIKRYISDHGFPSIHMV